MQSETVESLIKATSITCGTLSPASVDNHAELRFAGQSLLGRHQVVRIGSLSLHSHSLGSLNLDNSAGVAFAGNRLLGAVLVVTFGSLVFNIGGSP